MVRSKAWLKAVASLPCQLCGREGMTQAAHANWSVYGKGMGMKAHDCFTAALCQDCHREIDQGSTLSKQQRMVLWEDAFRRTLVALCETGRLKAK